MSWKIEEHSSFTVPNDKIFSGLAEIRSKVDIISSMFGRINEKQFPIYQQLSYDDSEKMSFNVRPFNIKVSFLKDRGEVSVTFCHQILFINIFAKLKID